MDNRVDEHQRRRLRPGAVAQPLGDAGDKIAPGTGSTKVQIAGKRTHFVGMIRGPQPPIQNVVGGNRVMHSPQCLVIVERENRKPRRRQGEGDPVGLWHVEVTPDKGSSMYPHEPCADSADTSIDPSWDVTVPPVNHGVPDVDTGQLGESS